MPLVLLAIYFGIYIYSRFHGAPTVNSQVMQLNCRDIQFLIRLDAFKEFNPDVARSKLAQVRFNNVLT